MLNVTEKGDITLTISGKLIATLYAPYCDTLMPKQLVAWENEIRRNYYEDIDGYYSVRNEMRYISSEAARARMNPDWAIRSAQDIREEYAAKRHEAIDA